jgi:hypothetical protein
MNHLNSADSFWVLMMKSLTIDPINIGRKGVKADKVKVQNSEKSKNFL